MSSLPSIGPRVSNGLPESYSRVSQDSYSRQTLLTPGGGEARWKFQERQPSGPVELTDPEVRTAPVLDGFVSGRKEASGFDSVTSMTGDPGVEEESAREGL